MKKWLCVCLCGCFLLCGWMIQKVQAEDTQEWIMESYLEELDFRELEGEIQRILPDQNISFRESVVQLLKGEIPLKWENVRKTIRNAFWEEISRQKNLVAQILLLSVTASVFTNFVKVFQKNQIAEITFYVLYLLLFTMLLNGFQSLLLTAQETIGQILQFMKMLLPIYLAVAVLAAGSTTAVVFYEATLFFITAVQMIMRYVVLPGIGCYVLLQLLNQLGKEDYLSKMAELLKNILSWTMKTLLALVIGVQTIQGLLLPAIDSLKNSVWSKAAGAVPVIGNTFSSVTETVMGTAILLKNAVGVSGLLIILFICLTPMVRLLVCTVLYKLVGAIVQPVSDKRVAECVSCVGDGIALLLTAVGMTGFVFLITLAMVTASIRQ